MIGFAFREDNMMDRCWMQRIVRRVWACVFALGLPVAAHATAVTLTPTGPTTVAVGETITFDLGISDAVDLFAFQFSLQFDPAIVQGLTLSEGPALGTAGTTFFIAGAFDNLSGLLELTGSSLIGAIPGFSGSGVLASLTFSALGPGTSAIELGDVLLLDSSFTIAEATLASSAVVVAEQAVPEPATLALVLTALAAAASTRGGARRRAG
ncbi:cohesin domain-containing protein [Rubrivivax gelatinosus]|uniref:cohesin domain-containing protein n=1 Tax=Rubrivivax gelatinosus TaxID=28068 RepID=UPI0019051ABE|nr:cohesin domain-containing protein [Rubrivivax gelatinosus]